MRRAVGGGERRKKPGHRLVPVKKAGKPMGWAICLLWTITGQSAPEKYVVASSMILSSNVLPLSAQGESWMAGEIGPKVA